MTDAAAAIAFCEEFEQLVERHRALFGEEVELPVIGGWVVIVATDDVAHVGGGFTRFVTPGGQWQHETIGLLETAKHTIIGEWRE